MNLRSNKMKKSAAFVAVRNERKRDSQGNLNLDPFWTKPYAGRALIREVLERPTLSLPFDRSMNFIEPSCGEGHLAEAVKPYFGGGCVSAIDIEDYGYEGQTEKRDFLIPVESPPQADWIIMNPPFTRAEAFLECAIDQGYARKGIAAILRLSFAEGARRFFELFEREPYVCAVFAKRTDMEKLRVRRRNPNGGQICYGWWVWNLETPTARDECRLIRINPRAQEWYERYGDYPEDKERGDLFEGTEIACLDEGDVR